MQHAGGLAARGISVEFKGRGHVRDSIPDDAGAGRKANAGARVASDSVTIHPLFAESPSYKTPCPTGSSPEMTPCRTLWTASSTATISEFDQPSEARSRFKNVAIVGRMSCVR